MKNKMSDEQNGSLDLERQEDEELMQSAFRWKKPTMEKLVMQRLFQATMSHDPYVIIEHTVNAASMVESQNQDVEILDFDLLRRLSKLNFAFKNYTTKHNGIVYCVKFPFDISEENYHKYIEEWKQNISLDYWEKCIKKHRILSIGLKHNRINCKNVFFVASMEEYQKLAKMNKCERLDYYLEKIPYCEFCGESIDERSFTGTWGTFQTDVGEVKSSVVCEVPSWSFFFEGTSCLSASGFTRLRDAFHCWAKDKCGHALAVMSGLVSQNVYDEVSKLYNQRQDGEHVL
ncbi:MAG: hypothetical protein IAX21_00625 [Candidatus Bathyarchaeota archaeon]|nr:MAG: hypothetical protein IAX21_00625 [Candidatus Bathyarchaeota archaeon]